jgi:hypothetical protein
MTIFTTPPQLEQGDCQTPPPALVQLDMDVNPLITGIFPDPYTEMTIGFAAVPDFNIYSEVVNTLPASSNTESPGLRLPKKLFTLAIVFQGVLELCACVAEYESLPETEDT